MSSKSVETKICSFCESQFKLSYDAEEVSGYPKFCPFCSESWEDSHSLYDEKDEDVGC